MAIVGYSEKSAAGTAIKDRTLSLSVKDLDLDMKESEKTLENFRKNEERKIKLEKKRLKKEKEADQMEKEWNKYSAKEKLLFILFTIIKLFFVIGFLYMFLLSLNFLSIGFTLVTPYLLSAKDTFGFFLANPFAAFAIGLFFTSILQDCTSTISISVTLVGAGIIKLKNTVPLIIGANIGSCVTNSLMAMTLTANDQEFKRAFSAATLIDIFNYLTASVILTAEILFGFMTFLSEKLASLMPNDAESLKKINFVSALVDPFVKLFIKLDEAQIEAVNNGSNTKQIALRCCSKPVYLQEIKNSTNPNQTISFNVTGCVECNYWCMPMLKAFGDGGTGLFWIIISLVLLLSCLFSIVKVLSLIIVGPIAQMIRRAINAEFPGKFKFLMQVILFFSSVFITIIIQSSNIVVATLVPLCAIGIISLQRVYVMSVASNVGTTITGILSAFTQPTSAIKRALQLAFVYVLFNIIGTLLWLPIPFMRFPKKLARKFSNIVIHHKWFIYVYVPTVFFILPLIVLGFALIPHWIGVAILGIPIAFIIICCLIIVLLRKCAPQILHDNLKDLKWLPIWMRSLTYWDKKVERIKCCKKMVKKKTDAKSLETKAELESTQDNENDQEEDEDYPANFFPNVIRRLSTIDSMIKEARIYTKRNKIEPKIDSSDEETEPGPIKENNADKYMWHANEIIDSDTENNTKF